MANKLMNIFNSYIEQNQELNNQDFINGLINVLKKNDINVSPNVFLKDLKEIIAYLTDKGNLIHIEEDNSVNLINKEEINKEGYKDINNNNKLTRNAHLFNTLLESYGIKISFNFELDSIILNLSFLQDNKVLIPFKSFNKLNEDELFQNIILTFAEHLWDNVIFKKNFTSLENLYDLRAINSNSSSKDIFSKEFSDTFMDDFWEFEIEEFLDKLSTNPNIILESFKPSKKEKQSVINQGV